MGSQETPRLSCHYTAYYECGECSDLATDDPLPEQCPEDNCEEPLAALKNWQTQTTLSAADLPPKHQ